MKNQLLKTGGEVKPGEHFIICAFPSPRLVLSTSLHNGGYLLADAVYNKRLNIFVNTEQDLPGGSMGNYLAFAAEEMGLDPRRSTGLLTSARMHCRSYSSATFEKITVEILATAGVDKNAVRAGDPALYYEDSGQYHVIGGTINIFAFTNAILSHGAMARALLTITEAKSAALQELAIVSPVTLNPATGTGTDGVILACDQNSGIVCTDTGTQAKLGELFCVAVKDAVKKSLALECGITPGQQGAVRARLRRMGIVSEIAADSPQTQILLAAAQAVRHEYRMGLIGKTEVQEFFRILQLPALQPAGSVILHFLNKNFLNFEGELS